MSPDNHHPFETTEYLERFHWLQRVKNKKLNVVPCISSWFDICGYGQVLESVGWQLTKLLDSGLFNALEHAYSLLGYPLISGVPPMPTERILVINDGIARTTDLADPAYINHSQFLFYVRDLLIKHFQLQQFLTQQSLGLRTVLAGGERCQYTPQGVTGHSILHYSGEPSEFGKGLLQQQFVYHPAEFQMNTAFAMAYTIEALGSKGGITPNRLYITGTWLHNVNAILPEPAVAADGVIRFLWGGSTGISIFFDKKISVSTKGFATDVFRVSDFVVHKEFEGDETHFPMAENDVF
ncbi:MAG: hypothetical protein KUL86_06385 [Castellaniella sp.]|nr:hypothetical protein [Castellaniella sp.]